MLSQDGLSMVYKTVELPILVTKFKQHTRLKNQLLESIRLGPGLSLIDNHDNISKTDWNLSTDIVRPYLEILTSSLVEHLKEAYLPFNSTGFQVHNFWFQQYKENSTHDWHVHQAAQYTNIYYLELPAGSPRTQILNPMDFNDVIEIAAEEGDIVTLPASVFHRSPPVIGNLQKTIISFNTSLLKLADIKKAD
jgi:predicted 2-oxoglutarate/Fe(II)-dependent dioxygenase YbiX